jgi:hypothetical protein
VVSVRLRTSESTSTDGTLIPMRLAPRLRPPSALAETYGSALPRLDGDTRVRKAHTKKVTMLPPLSSAVCARRRRLTDRGEHVVMVYGIGLAFSVSRTLGSERTCPEWYNVPQFNDRAG